MLIYQKIGKSLSKKKSGQKDDKDSNWLWFLIALFNYNDKYHEASNKLVKTNHSELITTLASVTETLHLLDFNRNTQADFLNWANAGAIAIELITLGDFSRTRALMLKYSNLPMNFYGFCRCCLMLLSKKLNISDITTINRDFDVYRTKGRNLFTILIK